MDTGPVTVAAAPRTGRRRPWAWTLAALVAVSVVAAVVTYLTAPRPGGQLDAEATGPDGAHALVALLRDRGVTVDVVNSVDAAVEAARPGTLLLFGLTQHVTAQPQLERLRDTRADLLLIEPTARTRATLSPGIRTASTPAADTEPQCDLREANQAGSADLGPSDTFQRAGDTTVTSCYGGALVRYADGDRGVTVVGSGEFLTNRLLPRAGNAALAMNLAGQRARLVWFVPQHPEGGSSAKGKIFDLIPDSVSWMVVQLWLTVALVALWKSRRLGPLVAEDLPVVVRASETVEGRGRLYRSRRARDRAAQALRGAALRRLLPRLGLGFDAQPPEMVATIAARVTADPDTVWHILFGPAPSTDADLTQLSLAVDDIERQIAGS